MRLCWTLPHTHLSGRWWKQLVWAVDLNASKSADDLLKFQSVLNLKRCGCFGTLWPDEASTQPVLGNLLGTLILGVFKLEMKRRQETGMTTTPKDRWLLVVLWDMFGLKVVRSIWSFLYSCIRKSYKGQLDVKVFPRSWGLLCYSNPESPFFFSLWGFTPQHLISVSCTRSTFCPRGSEWMTTVVFSSLCKLVNPAALFI